MTGMPWESQMLTLSSFPQRVSQYILQSLDKSQCHIKGSWEVVGKGFQLDLARYFPPQATLWSQPYLSEFQKEVLSRVLPSESYWQISVIRSLKFIMS